MDNQFTYILLGGGIQIALIIAYKILRKQLQEFGGKSAKWRKNCNYQFRDVQRNNKSVW